MPTLSELKGEYLAAKNAYYNKKKPIMSDAAFDRLEDKIKHLDPKWPELKKTGVKVLNKKVEVALRQPMPSLNKAYPPAFPSWLAKFPSPSYVAMHKIDGTSLLLTFKDGVPFKLVTRGDGLLGKDISFLLPALKIPNFAKTPGLTDLRLEAVISKANYKKWAQVFDDPRSMVNGIFNRRIPHPSLKDVDLVVLGCYGHKLTGSFGDLGGQLKQVPFEVVPVKKMTTEAMTELLSKARDSGRYAVDGLVIAPKDFVLDYKNNDKPKNIVAFKVNDVADQVEVTVEKIIWQVTGRKRIVPKIYIKPTKIGGVMVKHAAAHNAQWMQNRKIGPGAVVKVVRSGGVIPKIEEVVKAGKFQPPVVIYKTEGVHFVLDESKTSAATDNHVEVLNIVKFAKTMGIELIAGKTAADLHHAGLRSPMAYFRMFKQPAKMMQVFNDAGYAGAQGTKIRNEIAKCFSSELSLKRLMVAFQCFGVGIGIRKLDQIEDAGISMAEVLRCPVAKLPGLLSPVDGYSDKTIKVVQDGHSAWQDIVRELRLLDYRLNGKLPLKAKPKGILSGQFFSWTGYRSAEQEAIITANGGECIGLGSKTTTLFYNPEGKFPAKVEAARAKGVNCVVFSKFKI